MAISLIVDSTSDLPEEIKAQETIHVVPLTVHFGDEEYKDGVDITPTQFYEKLVGQDVVPTTSQVSPERFQSLFKDELGKGNQVVCVTIGSKASGTCQSAYMAKNELDSDDILIIDSNMLCMGTGTLAMLVLDWINEGKSLEEIDRLAGPYTENAIEHLFCVDTMEFLKKGGRVKASKALVAELLNIKPVLNVEDAITQPIGKVRGRKKIIPFYLKHMEKTMDFEKSPFLSVAHANDLAFAQEFIDAFKDTFQWDKPIYISEIGATIGSHAGPGVLAAFYIKK